MDLHKENFINIPVIKTDFVRCDDMYDLRQNISSAFVHDDAEVTIFISAYNRAQKLKTCIDSIIKYTKGFKYHILISDSSDDPETLAYLHTLTQPNVQILHVEGMGPKCQVGYKFFIALGMIRTPYLACIASDVIVTENWLSILMRCVKSDHRIGMAAPMATNVSNLQQVDFPISDLNELAIRAKSFNKSDPAKWRDRLRLVDLVALLPTGLLSAAGSYDLGYTHDFSEDDFCYRIRAAGYKLMLCGDVFVHHNHDFRNMEEKDPEEFENVLRIGREQYKNKHHGLDAWDDVNNFELELLSTFHAPQNRKAPCVLGVDCRMGTPILEVKNAYRAAGVFDAECCAFTTQAKYFADLQTFCDSNVVCDREAFLSQHYTKESFDAIILGEPLNAYENPYALLSALFTLLRPGGQLLVKLANAQSALALCRIVGQNVTADINRSLVDISIDDFSHYLDLLHVQNVRMALKEFQAGSAFKAKMRSVVSAFHPNEPNQTSEYATRLFTAEYCICIEK